jgi:hypothetical protein
VGASGVSVAGTDVEVEVGVSVAGTDAGVEVLADASSTKVEPRAVSTSGVGGAMGTHAASKMGNNRGKTREILANCLM